eukprot:10967112-Ditylum_brightwellii.AAC.1
MRSNYAYRDIFTGKYGRSAGDTLGDMVLRPESLKLDGSVYGPHGIGLQIMMNAAKSKKLRENFENSIKTYRGTTQYLSHVEWEETQENNLLVKEMEEQTEDTTCILSNKDNKDEKKNKPNKQQLSLTPTLFWYDNTHICETSHYRDYIFNPTYKMVARGGFVEDKLSPVITKSVERLGLRDGHDKFGCYIVDDHSGLFFTGHLDGGSYIDKEEKEKLYGSPV